MALLILYNISHHPLSPHQYGCRQGSQIRFACYEALVRKDICYSAVEQQCTPGYQKVMPKKKKKERHSSKPTRPTVTHTHTLFLHGSFGKRFSLPAFLSLPVVSRVILHFALIFISGMLSVSPTHASFLSRSTICLYSFSWRNKLNELLYLPPRVGGDGTLSV